MAYEGFVCEGSCKYKTMLVAFNRFPNRLRAANLRVFEVVVLQVECGKPGAFLQMLNRSQGPQVVFRAQQRAQVPAAR